MPPLPPLLHSSMPRRVHRDLGDLGPHAPRKRNRQRERKRKRKRKQKPAGPFPRTPTSTPVTATWTPPERSCCRRTRSTHVLPWRGKRGRSAVAACYARLTWRASYRQQLRHRRTAISSRISERTTTTTTGGRPFTCRVAVSGSQIATASCSAGALARAAFSSSVVGVNPHHHPCHRRAARRAQAKLAMMRTAPAKTLRRHWTGGTSWSTCSRVAFGAAVVATLFHPMQSGATGARGSPTRRPTNEFSRWDVARLLCA